MRIVLIALVLFIVVFIFAACTVAKKADEEAEFRTAVYYFLNDPYEESKKYNDILDKTWFKSWFNYYTNRLIEESVFYKEA